MSDRAHRRAVMVLTVALTVCILAIIVLGYYVATADRRPPTWDPLGVYPIQVVLDRVPGYENPAVPFSQGFVKVDGSKSNATDEPVTIRGRLSWILIDPPGGAVVSFSGEAERAPGVTTVHFENEFPPEVAARVERLHASGVDVSTWQIRGSDTPYRGHETGVPRPWQSQNFLIVYDAPPPEEP